MVTGTGAHGVECATPNPHAPWGTAPWTPTINRAARGPPQQRQQFGLASLAASPNPLTHTHFLRALLWPRCDLLSVARAYDCCASSLGFST